MRWNAGRCSLAMIRKLNRSTGQPGREMWLSGQPMLYYTVLKKHAFIIQYFSNRGMNIWNKWWTRCIHLHCKYVKKTYYSITRYSRMRAHCVLRSYESPSTIMGLHGSRKPLVEGDPRWRQCDFDGHARGKKQHTPNTLFPNFFILQTWATIFADKTLHSKWDVLVSSLWPVCCGNLRSEVLLQICNTVQTSSTYVTKKCNVVS